MGMVPTSWFCKDKYSYPTQEPGKAYNSDDTGFQTCRYEDGTPVNRSLAGPYAYCGGDGKVCDDNFLGVFFYEVYDARYRPWYVRTREWQRPNWSSIYLFTTVELGITSSYLIYRETENGRFFEGVIATDYRLDDVTNYLVDSYQDTPIIVSIYEDEEPYHLIAISTGTVSSRIVAIDDETRECAPGLEDDPNECTAIRVPVSTLDSSSYDKVIAEAHELHKSGGFPSTQLTVKCSEEIGTALYVSHSAVFEIPNENLRWRVIIASPATTSTEDAIQPSSPLFGSILFISGLGFITCLAFLAWLYLNRSKRAVITSDWRFTGLFIVGAALLNLTNLLLLGENTKASCMSRMWGFHLAFAVMISPLFVKIWRIKVLVGGDVRRRTITNQQAAMYTLSLIVLQIVILTILSVVDPLAPVEFTEVSEGVFTHHIVCDHSSRAGQFTELVFETTIIFIGCVLAYQCRDMDKEFGESKQLLFTISCDMGIGYGREWTQFTTSYWSSLDDSVLYFLVCSS